MAGHCSSIGSSSSFGHCSGSSGRSYDTDRLTRIVREIVKRVMREEKSDNGHCVSYHGHCY